MEPGDRSTAKTTRRETAFKIARVAVTVGAFGYILTRAPLAELADAWRSLSLRAFVLAAVFVFLSLLAGSFRWQLLLKAYGATKLPSFKRLVHLYFVGLFYNTYVPGGVGGDVVRGVASREAFGNDTVAGATGGVAVVFVERVCGVAALLMISAGGFLLWPIAGVDNVGRWAAAGLGIALTAIVALGLVPRLAPYLPAWLRKLAEAVPTLKRPGPFVGALLLSFAVQFASVLAGHVIVNTLWPSVTLQQSTVVMPLIGASAFFPLTIGGAGIREMAFAAFYDTVGVSEPAAVAASLAYWAALLLVAGFGGILSLFFPVTAKPVEHAG